MPSMAAKARTARDLERDIGGSMLGGASQAMGARNSRNAHFLAVSGSFLSKQPVLFQQIPFEKPYCR
jgi:hypothetical protein